MLLKAAGVLYCIRIRRRFLRIRRLPLNDDKTTCKRSDMAEKLLESIMKRRMVFFRSFMFLLDQFSEIK